MQAIQILGCELDGERILVTFREKDMKFLYSRQTASLLWSRPLSRTIGKEGTSSEETNVELKSKETLINCEV